MNELERIQNEYSGSDVVEQKEFIVQGGEILVFGDLHLSSVYEGSHKLYLEECLYNMGRITKIVEERKPKAVIFLGDIIGVRERNIRDRRFLREVLLFFMHLNEVCESGVFAVKGNHDFGDYPDFDLLIGLGYLKNPNILDFYGDDGSPQVRFHFVNYGYERKPLKLPEVSGFSNVVLCHADIQIPGVTNWYRTNGGYELSTMDNWRGVDFVFPGHIHNPSSEFSYTTLDSNSVALFYVGSPSRVAERYDDCWYLRFTYVPGSEGEESSVDFSAELFGLRPARDVFLDNDDFISDEDVKSDEELRQESLVNIVKEVMEGRVMSGDLFRQIELLPGASDRSKKIAADYLRKAMDEVK